MTLEAVPMTGAERARSTADAWWVLPAIPLFAAAVAFAWLLGEQLQRVYGMTGEAWDLAYDQQVIWNISQGHGFYSSFSRANSLGIHLEPILVVLAAVEKLWPSPIVLLIFSSAGLAATAPAAYLFLRAILPATRAESPWVAIALAAPIPFWAAIQEAARDFFHPENLALAFALLAAWAGIRGHRITMWCLCLLTLACQADQVYTIAVLALLVRSHGAPLVRKHWRLVLYLGVAWFLVGTGVVQQLLRNGGTTDLSYYAWLAGLDPKMPVSLQAIALALVRPEALEMLAAIIASMLALPLLAWRWSLLAIPPYLADVLSDRPLQNDLQLHYVLLLVFPLLMAGGIGARRLLEQRSIRPAVALALALPAVILGWGTGRVPPALLADQSLYVKPNAVAQLRAATAMIPAEAPVNADSGLTVWLANRHTINDFPDRLEGNAYVVIDDEAFIGRTTDAATRRRMADSLPTSGRRLLYDDGRFQVWSPVGD